MEAFGRNRWENREGHGVGLLGTVVREFEDISKAVGTIWNRGNGMLGLHEGTLTFHLVSYAWDRRIRVMGPSTCMVSTYTVSPSSSQPEANEL